MLRQLYGWEVLRIKHYLFEAHNMSLNRHKKAGEPHMQHPYVTYLQLQIWMAFPVCTCILNGNLHTLHFSTFIAATGGYLKVCKALINMVPMTVFLLLCWETLIIASPKIWWCQRAPTGSITLQVLKQYKVLIIALQYLVVHFHLPIPILTVWKQLWWNGTRIITLSQISLWKLI